MKYWKKTLIFLTIIVMVVLVPLSQTEGAQKAPLGENNGTTNAEIAAAKEQETRASEPVLGQCYTILGGINVKNCVNRVIYFVGDLASVLFFILLWLANEVFSTAISLSVKDFSEYANGDGIVTAWKISRDLVNMFLVFIMIYIGIGTMLNLSQVDAKKMIVKLIMVALLINFSAVLPKVVIDASNLLAIQFYDQMGDGKTARGSPAITKALMTRLGFFGLYGGSAPDKYLENYSEKEQPQLPVPGDAISGAIMYQFGRIIFIVVTTFMLLAGAFMFLKRTIVLLFLIMVSPLAVFSTILPQTKQHFNSWWKTLLNESLFAPAFLLLMYMTLEVVKNTDFIHNQSADGTSFNTGGILVTINFAVIIGLMWASLIIAHKMGASGASTATGWGKSLKGFGMGLVGGAAGAAGVYTIGRKAKELAASDRVKGWEKSKFGRLANDLVVKRGLDKLAKSRFGSSSSYQERVERVAGKIDSFKKPKDQAEFLASLSEVDRKEAYKKLSDRQKAELIEHVNDPASSLGAEQVTLLNKLAPDVGSENWEKLNKERRAVRELADIKKAKETLDKLATGTPPPGPQIDAAVMRLKGSTIKQIDPDILTDPQVAQNLSVSQLKALDDDGRLDDNQRKQIRQAIINRFNTLNSSMSGAINEQLRKAENWLNNNPAGKLF